MGDLVIRVTPRSRQTKVAVQTDGSLKVWVTAAPADGEANAAVCELLAKKLGVPKSAVSVIRGHTARTKQIRIDGIEPSEALKRLS